MQCMDGATCRRAVAKLDHLAEGDTGGREAGIVSDGVHQSLGGLPHGAYDAQAGRPAIEGFHWQ